MIKWIKNSRGCVRSSTGVKGVVKKADGKFSAKVYISNKKTGKDTLVTIGTYKTLNEAKKERIKYILNLL